MTAGQASALRTFKRIHDDLQKARDAEAAKRAGQPRHTEKAPKTKAEQEADDAATPDVTPTADEAKLMALSTPGAKVDTYA